MNERRQPIDPDSWDPPPRTKKSHRDRWEWLRNGCGTPDDRRNQVRLLGFMALWMLVFTAAAQTLKGNLDLGFPVEGWTALALAALPNALALVVLFAYLRFLRMTDSRWFAIGGSFHCRCAHHNSPRICRPFVGQSPRPRFHCPTGHPRLGSELRRHPPLPPRHLDHVDPSHALR